MELLFFYIFAVIAVGSAVCVITMRNPVHSAIALIVCLLQVAAFFILLRSPFLAAVQVFIYVGAVMVLFLFVVMVLDVGKEQVGEYLHHQAPWTLAVVIGLVLMLGYLITAGRLTAPLGEYTEEVLAGRSTEIIGKLLLTRYIFPFEVVSLLLLIALIGAVVLVMKEKKE